MSDIFKKVQSGQKFSMSAEVYNRMLDTIAQNQISPIGGGELSEIQRNNTTVRVRNTTSQNVPQYGILGFDNPAITPTMNLDEFRERIILDGVTPSSSHAGRFVVTLEPIAAGEIGRCVVLGVVQVQIQVVSAAHEYVTVIAGNTSRLITASSGTTQILWKEATGLPRWALVRLGNSQAAPCFPDGTPTLPGITFCASTVSGMWRRQGTISYLSGTPFGTEVGISADANNTYISLSATSPAQANRLIGPTLVNDSIVWPTTFAPLQFSHLFGPRIAGGGSSVTVRGAGNISFPGIGGIVTAGGYDSVSGVFADTSIIGGNDSGSVNASGGNVVIRGGIGRGPGATGGTVSIISGGALFGATPGNIVIRSGASIDIMGGADMFSLSGNIQASGSKITIIGRKSIKIVGIDTPGIEAGATVDIVGGKIPPPPIPPEATGKVTIQGGLIAHAASAGEVHIYGGVCTAFGELAKGGDVYLASGENTGGGGFAPSVTHISHGITGTTRHVQICRSSDLLGFYDAPAVTRPAPAGVTTGYNTPVPPGGFIYENTTATGGIGTTAYTVGDIVRALKLLGLIQ